MIRNLFRQSKEASVLVGIKNLIVLLLWFPVIAILWGVGIGIGIFGYRYGRYGDLPDLGSALSGLNSTDSLLVVVAILAAVGGLYLILANVTFGESNVESGVEQGQDILDEAGERR